MRSSSELAAIRADGKLALHNPSDSLARANSCHPDQTARFPQLISHSQPISTSPLQTNCSPTAAMGFTDFLSDVWDTFSHPSPEAEAPPQGGTSTDTPASGTDEESKEEADVNKDDAKDGESEEQGHKPSGDDEEEGGDEEEEEEEEEETVDPKEQLEEGKSVILSLWGGNIERVVQHANDFKIG